MNAQNKYYFWWLFYGHNTEQEINTLIAVAHNKGNMDKVRGLCVVQAIKQIH